MMQTLPTGGLWMLFLLAALIFTTGLPVWALLIATASLFSALGCLWGVMDVQVLSAVSGRILGLLDNDLLQALPLYVFVGMLLQRLNLADTLFLSLCRIFRWTGAEASVAAFGVATLVAPMNGSVASSAALMARLVAPRLKHINSACAMALISVSSTIGVVVPPSLVLILLGNAMMNAHIEASNLPGFVLGAQRIISTQDLFHAALLPAGIVLALWLLIAWAQGRVPPAEPSALPLTKRQWVLSISVMVGAVLLLGGVFRGFLLAVEAAATGGVVLTLATLLSGALTWPQWRGVLADTLNMSGALLALLVGATTFSLVFRLWGTDHWITNTVLASHLPGAVTAALVLLLVALCAWVLDAFEMIFVIVPIVAPLLVLLLGDAQQTAVLLLLVLQLSFLIPPMGYAVMISRSQTGMASTSNRRTIRALLPFIGAQCAVTLAVFVSAPLVHQLDASQAPATAMSGDDLDQQIREMSGQSK